MNSPPDATPPDTPQPEAPQPEAPQPEALPRAAPLALWRAAGAFLNLLYTLFGDPRAVASRGDLARATHKTIASWLRAGEATMRRLLLIEAAALAKPETRPPQSKPHKRVRKLMRFEAEHPEHWRVSFRCFPAAPRRAKMRVARRTPSAPRPRSAWPLAERYEALLRVFNDPSACAARLARRLHAAPNRVALLLHAPPEAESRVAHFAELTAAAATQAARFNSS